MLWTPSHNRRFCEKWQWQRLVLIDILFSVLGKYYIFLQSIYTKQILKNKKASVYKQRLVCVLLNQLINLFNSLSIWWVVLLRCAATVEFCHNWSTYVFNFFLMILELFFFCLLIFIQPFQSFFAFVRNNISFTFW